MEIINLTMNQYRNYARRHSMGNFGQTVEYSMMSHNNSKKKLFLGLKDDDDNIHAAALILVTTAFQGIKEASAPDGFLIDYANFDLVKSFTLALRTYLEKEGVTYLITDPMFRKKVYNKERLLIQDNQKILDNLFKLDYTDIGYNSSFSKYDAIIEANDSINDIYRRFNRNTKRNIKEGLNLGITLHRGSIKDIDKAYLIFKKKTSFDLAFYRDLMKNYNNDDNKMEVFFAKINPHKYLVNTKRMYEEEKIRNERIHELFLQNVGNITPQLVNKKMSSDSALEKYRNELNKAIKLNQEYTDSIIIATSITIKNKHEVYFLIDGYKEEFRNIHATHILKWAIIDKYYKDGYRKFNLGEIYDKDIDKANKYYGQCMYKLGFGANIVEYSPKLLFVVNKTRYNLYTKLIKKK